MFEAYINQIAPEYVKVKVTPKHGGEGYVCPIDLPAYKAAEEAIGIAFGKNHWQFVEAEVFLSFLPLNVFWESRPSLWDLVWSKMQSIHQTKVAVWIFLEGNRISS